MRGPAATILRALSLTAALSTWPVLTVAETQKTTVPLPAIAHEPLRCMRAKEFPRVDAGVASPVEVKRTRVYFKAHQHPDWYYVDMRALEAQHYLALLPQPLPETKQIDYYVQALDSYTQSAQTETYVPEVNRDRCVLTKTAAWSWPERIAVGATKEKQPPIPPGFSKKGIFAFVAVSGAVISGSALAGGGGGISTTALVVGGGSALGAGAVVVSRAGSKQSANQAPTLGINVSPTTALVGFTRVSGKASASDPEGGAVVCEWDFGDGDRATGTTVEHVYQQTGTFTIAVTVSDPSGASTKSTSVVRVGSLTGLWHCPNLGTPPATTSDWRCIQNANRLDCQSDLDQMPTANGSLRQPASIDLVYRYLDVYHAFPYNFVDVDCSGDVRADFSHFDCFSASHANNNYGMDRISQ